MFFKKTKDIIRPPRSKILVILHLYYIDMFDFFVKEFESIGDYDMLITVPVEKFGELPKEIFNRDNISVIVNANRGRDILPFMVALRKIDLGYYEAILKVHTKRSPHYDKGDVWLNDMMGSLCHLDVQQVKELFVDQSNNVEIIGPKQHYLSLRVNFEANGSGIERILGHFFSQERIEEVLQEDRKNYGFFAGSMFWISPRYCDYILRRLKPGSSLFERESGQIDGTYAHALERVFTLISEINGNKLYASDERGRINKIQYESGVIPEWSDLK